VLRLRRRLSSADSASATLSFTACRRTKLANVIFVTEYRLILSYCRQNLSEMKLNYASIYSTTTILLCSVILHKCRIWCNFCIFIITVDSLAICHSCERGGGVNCQLYHWQFVIAASEGGGLIANYMNFGVYLRC